MKSKVINWACVYGQMLSSATFMLRKVNLHVYEVYLDNPLPPVEKNDSTCIYMYINIGQSIHYYNMEDSGMDVTV